jgi:hypothetical protein
MSGSIILAVKSVFDDSGLKKAQKDFGSVGRKLKGILGAVGLGVGLSAATSFLKEAGKAAVTDAKSQAILAQALKNTVGANDEVIASVEKSIAKFSIQNGIVDDQLRPAFQSLVMATGSVANANDLMQMSLDLSATKQISVEKAASILGKAFNGNTMQLTRLMPELKGSTNLFGDLQQSIKGMAEQAANTDPFARINVIFSEMQETIGRALIPYFQQLTTYLASPVGQKQMNDLANSIAGVVTMLGDSLGFIIQNREAIAKFAIVLGGLAAAIGIASVAMGVYLAVTKGAGLAQALLVLGAGIFSRNGVMIAAGIGVITASVALLGLAAQDAANAQIGLNNAAAGYKPGVTIIQGSPTGDDGRPDNPMPGYVHTWYNGFAWYQVTWDGKTWSRPKKMTYTKPDNGGDNPPVDPFKAFTSKMSDDAKKIRALANLTGKGLSEGLAKSIVDSGADWVKLYNTIVSTSKSGLKDLQKTWNKTANGLEELGAAKKAAYEQQKQDDADYAASVKDTFAGIRDSILGAFSITSMGESAAGLLNNIDKLIAQTKAFSANINTLAAQNLNATLLNQLIAAGPMEGGRLAASLVASGVGTIGRINTSFNEFQGLAAGIAQTGTAAQFGAKANTVVNLTVNAGMGADGASIGRQVVDAISAFERQSGPVYAKVG